MKTSSLRLGARGHLLILLFVSAVAVCAPAQSVTTLHFFHGFDGSGPGSEVLTQGQDGNLYGTTLSGGFGGGNVFQLSPNGSLNVLHDFQGSDGWHPVSGLLLGPEGSFYGNTYSRGSFQPSGGTLYKIAADGNLTVLDILPKRLENPIAPFVQGDDGNFYGTTPGEQQFFTPGTVFRMTAEGKITLLHSFFSGGRNGENPTTGLFLNDDGNFYGTTSRGGVGDCGTIFRVSPSGKLTTLHTFFGLDGCKPFGNLIKADDGNFYGTTYSGGIANLGIVYRFTPRGNLVPLHSFGLFDGAGPTAGLVQATDGKLYGTTSSGAFHNFGSIFFITTDGILRTVFEFNGFDGLSPEGGLLQHTNGTLYGTTTFGGFFNNGTIFALDVGAPASVKTTRPSGQVGSQVGILGQGFLGATAVTFHGTPTQFSILSDTYLVAVVPPGATTGVVEVTTADGALDSHTMFRVLP